MTSKRRRELYENGRPGEVYGIWNSITKRFVFGIREDTPKRAWGKFRREHRKSAYCARYEWRRIPSDWVNPLNQLWRGADMNTKNKGGCEDGIR